MAAAHVHVIITISLPLKRRTAGTLSQCIIAKCLLHTFEVKCAPQFSKYCNKVADQEPVVHVSADGVVDD